MLFSMLGTFILQILAVQYAGGFFNTIPLSFNTWIKIIAMAFIVIIASEVLKIFIKNNIR